MGADSFEQEYPVTRHTSDEGLIEALKARQIGALREIYRRHGRLIYSLALRIVKRAEEAEDLTQEVLLSLWQHPAYDPRRGSLKQFLVLLTRSRAIDRLRSHHARHRTLKRWQPVAEPLTINPPLDQVSQGERAQRVQQALSSLPAAEREVLEIAYYEGLSQSAIAQRLDIPLGTVKSRCRQGLKKLRRALTDFI